MKTTTFCFFKRSHPNPQNVTLFGIRAVADLVKMRSYRVRVGPKFSDWCPYETQIQKEQTHRGKMVM